MSNEEYLKHMGFIKNYAEQHYQIYNGEVGVAGSAGCSGIQGVSGMQGISGMTGPTGMQGPMGMQGNRNGRIYPEEKASKDWTDGAQMFTTIDSSLKRTLHIQTTNNSETQYVGRSRIDGADIYVERNKSLTINDL